MDKIILAANEPLEIAGRQLTIGLSAGTALYPDDGTSSGSITRAADVRMYQSKAGNRNRQPASLATSE